MAAREWRATTVVNDGDNRDGGGDSGGRDESGGRRSAARSAALRHVGDGGPQHSQKDPSSGQKYVCRLFLRV